MFDFRGRKVIVTGGSRGIGRAIAANFLAAGAAVSVCARKHKALDEFIGEASAPTRLHTAICDLSDAASIKTYVATAAETLGGIDILVNNVSAFARADTEEEWQMAFSTDVMGTVRTSRAALPWLERAQDAAIVHITSIAGTRPSVVGRRALLRRHEGRPDSLYSESGRTACKKRNSREFRGAGVHHRAGAFLGSTQIDQRPGLPEKRRRHSGGTSGRSR